MLELVSRRDARSREILAPLRARYFLTGEINTPGRRRRALKLQELKERYGPRAASPTSTGSRSTPRTGT